VHRILAVVLPERDDEAVQLIAEQRLDTIFDAGVRHRERLLRERPLPRLLL
jgi:hypothetical protein